MLILIAAAAAAASACAAAPSSSVSTAMLCTASAVAYPPPIGGGWSAVETDDEGVQAAAAFAAGELGSELGSVESAERQVVAGMNYRLKLSLSDGRTFNVVVFRALNGTYQLTSNAQIETDSGSNESSGD